MSPNGNFIDATPIPDTIVVNAGDLLARWSNDSIRSTKHQVVEPPTPAETHPARYSIAYFCDANYESIIDAIPGTYDEVHAKKYEPIKRLGTRYLMSLHDTDDSIAASIFCKELLRPTEETVGYDPGRKMCSHV